MLSDRSDAPIMITYVSKPVASQSGNRDHELVVAPENLKPSSIAFRLFSLHSSHKSTCVSIVRPANLKASPLSSPIRRLMEHERLVIIDA